MLEFGSRPDTTGDHGRSSKKWKRLLFWRGLGIRANDYTDIMLFCIETSSIQLRNAARCSTGGSGCAGASMTKRNFHVLTWTFWQIVKREMAVAQDEPIALQGNVVEQHHDLKQRQVIIGYVDGETATRGSLA